MAGYANRLVRIDFPELSNEDDPIWVVILNPKTVSLRKLSPKDVQMDANGNPLAGEAETATYEAISNLIHDWHVYDAEDYSDEPALLPLPATAEVVAKLPIDIITAIGDRMKGATAPPQ